MHNASCDRYRAAPKTGFLNAARKSTDMRGAPMFSHPRISRGRLRLAGRPRSSGRLDVCGGPVVLKPNTGAGLVVGPDHQTEQNR